MAKTTEEGTGRIDLVVTKRHRVSRGEKKEQTVTAFPPIPLVPPPPRFPPDERQARAAHILGSIARVAETALQR